MLNSDITSVVHELWPATIRQVVLKVQQERLKYEKYGTAFIAWLWVYLAHVLIILDWTTGVLIILLQLICNIIGQNEFNIMQT